MSTLHYDVVVLGSGISAFAAVQRLHSQGKKVAVITNGPGATAVSSGAFDIGSVALRTDQSFEQHENGAAWRKAFSQVLLSVEYETLIKHFKEGSQEWIAELKNLSPLQFSFDRPYIIPTIRGDWKATFGAQALQAACDVHKLLGKHVGFVSSEAFRTSAKALVRQWQGQLPYRFKDFDMEPLFCNFPGITGDVPYPHFATRLLHNKAFQDECLDAVRKAIAGKQYSFLLFPPFFLDHTMAAQWSKILGVTIGECLSAKDAIAGHRLSKAIYSSFQNWGVPIYFADRIDTRLNGDLVHAINVFEMKTQQWTWVEGKKYILSTGKFFGGGIQLGYHYLKETVFQLPLFLGRGKPRVAFRNQIDWNYREFVEAQDWSRLGIQVNERFQPVGEGNEVIYRNLHACGSVLGGVDFARSGLGMGFMALTGRSCGDEVAKA